MSTRPGNGRILTSDELRARLGLDQDDHSADLTGRGKTIAELNLQDESGYYQQTKVGGADEGWEEEKEEEKKKLEEAEAYSELMDDIVDAWYDDGISYAFNNSADYRNAALGFEQSLVWNSHAANMMPGAENAEAESRANADQKFAAVDGKTITAPDGSQIRLNSMGQYVNQNNEPVDRAAVDAIDPAKLNSDQDRETLQAMRDTQFAQDNAGTMNHVANVRRHQTSELASMEALEKYEREKALAQRSQEQEPGNPGIRSSLSASASFNGVADGAAPSAITTFTPSPAFQAAVREPAPAPAAPAGM